jgi:hypothetical protein
LFHTAAKPDQVATQFKDAGFQSFAGGQRVEEMRIRLQPLPIRRLERTQFLRLAFAGVDWERFVDEEVPDLFAPFPRVERLVLGIADATKLAIRLERFGPVTIADNLEHAFALIDLLAQHGAEVAGFGAEDVLPDRLVTEKRERVRGELAAAPELTADRGNEDERKRGHGT